MSNEEKTKEIGRGYGKETRIFAYSAALEMAQWKDEKFYKILACVKYSFDRQGLNGKQFVEDMKKQWEDD